MAETPLVFEIATFAVLAVFFVVMALIFGGLMWFFAGSKPAIEFYSGWLTEYSLSIDNLFVFVIIMSNFAVPKELQKFVLSVGITVALVLRGMFILVGAAIISRFTWVFFLFGAFLIVTAIKLVAGGDEDEEYHENALIHALRKVIKITDEYDGEKLRTIKNGVKHWTPMLIVFTSNVFALLGLQQLYFLLGELLDKLVYLPLGLSVVLGFIGVKLIMEALHGNSLPFLNGGQPISWVPEVPTWLSLVVIVLAIGGAALASVIKMRTMKANEK